MRYLLLLAAAALTLSGCGTDATGQARQPVSSTTPPPVDPSYWSTAPQTDAQRAEVATRARLIDVCALVPRTELAELGAVREVVNDQTDSCRVELGGEGSDTYELNWASMIMFDDVPRPGASVVPLGAASLSLMPEHTPTATERSCSAIARFPAGAALYLDATTFPSTDPCARLETVAAGAVERWLTAPPQGSSPDTQLTVLHGADPCAVRALLEGTGPFGSPTLKNCGFTYRGVDVVVSYENRGPLGDATVQMPDGRTAHSIDDTSYTVVVGPALPGEPSYFGPSAPVVDVFADSPEVATEVLRQVLTLFPVA
ncbi:peptidase [Nocardia halotolerans]|uniref:Peptidase n=1 Tax=Nocardia halotolerans TaxID=1755878 RepID=A0ABV8VJT5_9NOCA